MLVEPPMPLLPATLGKLKRVAEGDAGDGLGLLDANDKAVLSEDGLRRFARSEYAAEDAAHSKATGSLQGSLTVYQFGDASGAVAAYDLLRRPGMQPERLGDEALSDGGELLLRSGANVVAGRFKLDHLAMIALTRELIGELPKVIGAAANAPLLPTLLLGKGIDEESVRYALGPVGYKATGGVLPAAVVGFDRSAEALTAKDSRGGVLTLLLYPTPQIAGEQERAIQSLGIHSSSTTDSAPTSASTQATVLAGTVKMRREGTLLVLTTGAWSPAEAESMVNGIHLHDEDVGQADATRVPHRVAEDLQPAGEHRHSERRWGARGVGAGPVLRRRPGAGARDAGEAGGQRARVSAHRPERACG
jgi:hypothetical protein